MHDNYSANSLTNVNGFGITRLLKTHKNHFILLGFIATVIFFKSFGNLPKRFSVSVINLKLYCI